MTVIVIIYFSLLFLIIGYYIGKYIPDKEKLDTSSKKGQVIEEKHPVLHKGGVIGYPSQEEVDYEESGERKVDEERERIFREQFKL